MRDDKDISKDEIVENEEDLEQSDNSDNDSNGSEVETRIDVKETSEYKELNDRYLRLVAEFDNYKKRSAKEYNRLVETAESNLILDLLNVVDDFSRALKQDTSDLEKYKQGIEMINTKLMNTLENRGLQHMKVINEEFDPNFHEAVMQIEMEDKEDGIIVEEVQSGYYLNDKVLRPAKVVVAKKKEPSGDEE